MEFQMAQPDSFYAEIGRAPEKVKKAFTKNVLPVLRHTPAEVDGQKIKKLDGFKDIFRFRISDEYRLIYRVQQKEEVVTLLMLGHRKEVYDRLRIDSSGKADQSDYVLLTSAAELLDKEPSPTQKGKAFLQYAENTATDVASPEDKPLPIILSREKLTEWSIPNSYHDFLIKIRTEGELLSLLSNKIPREISDKILNSIFPPKIEEIIQKPLKIFPDNIKEEDVLSGNINLKSLLLKLDEDQESFVSRFEKDNPKGPWLLKGGPGSGKSTIALYCIKNLIQNANSRLPGFNDKPKILFSTYTKSLTNASDLLLGELSKGYEKIATIRNADSLAGDYLDDDWKHRSSIQDEDAIHEIGRIVNGNNKYKYYFRTEDASFIYDEIRWVVAGQGLESEDEYLRTDRVGRKRGLGVEQRRVIWSVYHEFLGNMNRRRQHAFCERYKQAYKRAFSTYDYVFIDEAQDLPPIAIRFLIKLCKNPENIFITADGNQSIYGNGISWSKVAADLKFSGRAKILRKNYRTTKAIWEAIRQIIPENEDLDKETFDAEPVFNGPQPILSKYETQSSLGEKLSQFIKKSLIEERLTLDCAAVLCPNGKEMQRVQRVLSPDFNARVMRSGNMDLSHPGLKIMTMHAAKGLQFPVVAVVGLEEGVLPRGKTSQQGAEDDLSRERKLFFVACSRAMRRLMVLCPKGTPSSFLKNVTDDYWETDENN